MYWRSYSDKQPGSLSRAGSSIGDARDAGRVGHPFPVLLAVTVLHRHLCRRNRRAGVERGHPDQRRLAPLLELNAQGR